jgi:hypothetical protein
MPSTDRHSELREWATQPFKQERASRNVLSEQARAPSAVGETQHPDLVRRCVTTARDNQFQDSRGAVVAEGFGDESFGRTGISAADGDPPFHFKAPDEPRKLVEPSACSNGQRLLSDNTGNVEHAQIFHAPAAPA